MIVDAAGRPAVTGQTTTTFSPQLVAALVALSDLLQQNGLGLFCMKCHRLGLPDGVQCDNRPDDDVYRMTCGCAVREFHKVTGKERVTVQ